MSDSMDLMLAVLPQSVMSCHVGPPDIAAGQVKARARPFACHSRCPSLHALLQGRQLGIADFAANSMLPHQKPAYIKGCADHLNAVQADAHMTHAQALWLLAVQGRHLDCLSKFVYL